jgi:hypothetical protein
VQVVDSGGLSLEPLGVANLGESLIEAIARIVNNKRGNECEVTASVGWAV